MIPYEAVLYLITPDQELARQVIRELLHADASYQLPLAANLAQARRGIRLVPPAAILLDAAAVAAGGTGETLETVVARLAEAAPVIVVGPPEHQEELALLIASGDVDFVARVGNFVPIAAGLLERRARAAQQPHLEPPGASALAAQQQADFGEVLRHEVNNPLTGILGNAELLLAEYRKKNGAAAPPLALQRLQTIAELAVRLRETVRRLSNAWQGSHDHARSA